jgi:hypothetical protein
MAPHPSLPRRRGTYPQPAQYDDEELDELDQEILGLKSPHDSQFSLPNGPGSRQAPIRFQGVFVADLLRIDDARFEALAQAYADDLAPHTIRTIKYMREQRALARGRLPPGLPRGEPVKPAPLQPFSGQASLARCLLAEWYAEQLDEYRSALAHYEAAQALLDLYGSA